jgi:hypothetical protein
MCAPIFSGVTPCTASETKCVGPFEGLEKAVKVNTPSPTDKVNRAHCAPDGRRRCTRSNGSGLRLAEQRSGL